MADDAQGSESERRARQLAERALDRLARLHRVTAGLAEALTQHQVASVVMEQGIAALEASSGRIALVRADGRAMDVIASVGYTYVQSPVPIDVHLPTNEVIRTGHALFEHPHQAADVIVEMPMERNPGRRQFQPARDAGGIALRPGPARRPGDIAVERLHHSEHELSHSLTPPPGFPAG